MDYPDIDTEPDPRPKTRRSFRSIPENEVTVKLLVDRLREVNPLEIIMSSELVKVSMCDELLGSKRHLLQRARTRLKRDEGILFVAVVGVGLKRCDDILAIDDGGRKLIQARRTAKRGAESLACVRSFESLPKEKQAKMLTLQTYTALISTITRGNKIKQLELSMAKKNQSLPWKESLEFLKGTT